jgi:hypothetical protein
LVLKIARKGHVGPVLLGFVLVVGQLVFYFGSCHITLDQILHALCLFVLWLGMAGDI